MQKTRALPDGMKVVSSSSSSSSSSLNEKEDEPSVVSLPPGAMCASLDGDADRVVFFSAPETNEEGGGEKSKVKLLDGDRIASLLALFVKTKILAQLNEAAEAQGEEKLPLTIGQVQTAYANGAARAFAVKALSSSSGGGGGEEEQPLPPPPPPPPLARTGVKHLHAAAEKFDVGVYFEANGHGALLLSERFLRVAAKQREKEDKNNTTAASLGLALAKASNQAVGDALSGLLLVDAALRHLRWDFDAWQGMYSDLPSQQRVVRVRDRGVVGMSEDESAAVAPAALAAAVEAAVEKSREKTSSSSSSPSSSSSSSSRAFARPSGTEDVVRVYAEAETREACEELALEVARAVWDHAGALGRGREKRRLREGGRERDHEKSKKKSSNFITFLSTSIFSLFSLSLSRIREHAQSLLSARSEIGSLAFLFSFYREKKERARERVESAKRKPIPNSPFFPPTSAFPPQTTPFFCSSSLLSKGKTQALSRALRALRETGYS